MLSTSRKTVFALFHQIPIQFYFLALLGIISSCTTSGRLEPALYGELASETATSKTAVAYEALFAVQSLSISENREYCGLVIQRKDGSFYRSSASRGGVDWCIMPAPSSAEGYQIGDRIVADFHTHAGYRHDADSEVPSVQDMDGNRRAGIPGFLATPGGRFWFISHDGTFARQLCRAGCMPVDPKIPTPHMTESVAAYWTYEQLLERQN